MSLVSIWVILLFYSYWLLGRGGAEKLTRHPGLLKVQLKAPTTIKQFWLLTVLGSIIATVIIFSYKK
jgi:hypothetical protein